MRNVLDPPLVLSFKCRPQYWEIYQRKEVIGISMTFIVVDLCGGVFSILSLAFKEKIDVFASGYYAVIVVSCPLSFVRGMGLTIPHSILRTYAFTGYGYSYCDRSSHLEPHREA